MKGLSKITVIDFSKLLPGPFATMALADLGCRVIRVELPHWPDVLRVFGEKIHGQGAFYWMANRNKESVCLDFRKPAGKKALLKLIAKADCVVEGFRPGTMAKMGLGPKELCRKFPRLIYCSLTGYGQEGPMARLAGHDINFLAESGLLGAGDSARGFSFPATQIADLCGAQTAAIGILAALLERAKGGKGRHVDVAMSEAVFAWMVLPVGQALATGRPYEPHKHWWSGKHAFYRLYRTKDGRRLAVGALETNFAVDLLRQLGRDDLVELLGAEEDGSALVHLSGELAKIFSSRTLHEWERFFHGKDVCVAPVRTVEEAMNHYSRVRRPMLFRHGKGAPYMRSAVRFSQDDFALRKSPPRLGADNEKVLSSFGLGKAEIGRLKRAGLLKKRRS